MSIIDLVDGDYAIEESLPSQEELSEAYVKKHTVLFVLRLDCASKHEESGCFCFRPRYTMEAIVRLLPTSQPFADGDNRLMLHAEFLGDWDQFRVLQHPGVWFRLVLDYDRGRGFLLEANPDPAVPDVGLEDGRVYFYAEEAVAGLPGG